MKTREETFLKSAEIGEKVAIYFVDEFSEIVLSKIEKSEGREEEKFDEIMNFLVISLSLASASVITNANNIFPNIILDKKSFLDTIRKHLIKNINGIIDKEIEKL